MQAKSFLGEKRGAVRHFYATVIRGEVSDANVQGYLRAASQIEDVWQQIDEKIATLISQGIAPWEAYRQLHYPLAFIRAARTYQVFVRELLAADAAFDPQQVQRARELSGIAPFCLRLDRYSRRRVIRIGF